MPLDVGEFLQRFKSRFLIGFAATGLVVGGLLNWFAYPVPAGWAWSIATAPVLFGLLLQITVSLRKGDIGLDIVAALSMSAALVFGEPLAANVVAMMYAGGQLLEDFAQGRAKKEMAALMGRVAQTAMRFDGDALHKVAIAEIKPGDRLLIRQGDVLPVDGRVVSEVAVLDLSALTGEALPQNIMKGSEALSGSASAGAAFELVASRPATESTYAGIVRLVEAAQSSKAPMVRMADRYAIGFLALTVAIAALTWFLTQDTIRVLFGTRRRHAMSTDTRRSRGTDVRHVAHGANGGSGERRRHTGINVACAYRHTRQDWHRDSWSGGDHADQDAQRFLARRCFESRSQSRSSIRPCRGDGA